jgi:hypothetical protein
VIDFRYHLVSIIAIFFALAAGIALGAGPLKAGVDQTLTQQTQQLREENQGLRDQIATLDAGNEYRDSFVGAVTPDLVERRLADRRVVVVALPGADTEQVTAVRDSVAAAGADVGATVTVDATWTDSSSAQLLDTLATELVSTGTTLPEGDGYDRGAAVLAGALVEPVGGPGSEGNATVLSAFVEAGVVAVDGEAEPEAQLAVVVAGEPLQDDEAERRTGALVSLVAALDGAGAGAVAAGPAAAAGAGGIVAAVRADGDVSQLASTVDVANLPSGRVAVVFALAEQAAGASGHYGIVGTTDGPLPAATEGNTS